MFTRQRSADKWRAAPVLSLFILKLKSSLERVLRLEFLPDIHEYIYSVNRLTTIITRVGWRIVDYSVVSYSNTRNQ
jgi:hypothetical protein